MFTTTTGHNCVSNLTHGFDVVGCVMGFVLLSCHDIYVVGCVMGFVLLSCHGVCVVGCVMGCVIVLSWFVCSGSRDGLCHCLVVVVLCSGPLSSYGFHVVDCVIISMIVLIGGFISIFPNRLKEPQG